MGVALALGCGCSSGGGSARPPASTTSRPKSTTAIPSTSATASTTTTTILATGPPLESLILKIAPSGYSPMADSVADTGSTNFAKAAVDDPFGSPAAAKAALVSAGFLRGYERQWATSDAIGQNFLFLYQFATPAGAQEYVLHWQAGIEATGGGPASVPVPFAPSLIPGAIGLRSGDKTGSSGIVLFSKGPYAVEAEVAGGPSINQSLPANALALAQYTLLPPA